MTIRYSAPMTFFKLTTAKTTRATWLSFRKQIATEIASIKADKSDVFASGPSVHGARQRARLDVLDVQEMRFCALFDKVSDQIGARR